MGSPAARHRDKTLRALIDCTSSACLVVVICRTMWTQSHSTGLYAHKFLMESRFAATRKCAFEPAGRLHPERDSVLVRAQALRVAAETIEPVNLQTRRRISLFSKMLAGMFALI